ncbi:tetratricopeptide repeat protein [Dethiobacter alkaliphilus]|uniref:Tetratricopeptide TPR_2 repeat protein n=1 Tax=Dethiobacter alkaliphilus AHT 1 TaxID=555088 RepID=C0GG21_DETAL|nr:tetratricopeptide repeat protein [Dethiobacter alkaliphilus]EEG77710.1 Tetratricopeptide TPR_2 repeat protein [Dethiobacter alkaliphilus AHT 1]
MSEKGSATTYLVAVLVILLGAAYVAVYFHDDLFAVERMERSDYEFELARQTVEANPYNWDAKIVLGKAYYYRKEYALAAELFKDALQMDEENSEATYYLGLSKMGLEEYEEAEKYLRQAVSLARYPDQLYYALGDVAMAKNDYESAIDYYLMARERMPNTSDVLISLAGAYEAEGMLDEAIELLEDAGRFSPELVDQLNREIRRVEQKR